MADKWQEYTDDPRTVCKYGTKCYQKNPEHHKNFKHPPLKKKVERNSRRYSPYARQDQDVLHKQTKNTTNTKQTTPNSKEQTTNFKKNAENDEVQSERKQDSPKTDENTKTIKSLNIKLPDEIKFYSKDTDISIVKELFLVEMPSDFFKFFEFINEAGECLEKTLSDVNLELIGPYDLLRGKLPMLDDKELYLIHWRFFYDPPEFQAVLKKKNSEYHIGYIRDTPDQQTPFLASTDSGKKCNITPLRDNIFGAFYSFLLDEKKASPFTSAPCQKLIEKLKTYCNENDISLSATLNIKTRQSKIVAPCFHGLGIIVPYNKKTQLGYRRLAETDANLKKMFQNLEKATSQEDKDKILSDLQVVVTNASIAVDESDFGTALELGIDLFCSGLKELESMALSNLTTAYTVLDRKPFAQIAQAHMKYRRKGPNMSILS